MKINYPDFFDISIAKKCNVGMPRNSIKFKKLTLAMMAMLSMPIVGADTGGKNIGDLEVYYMPQQGHPKILMMVDNSNSMAGFTMNTDTPGACSNSSFDANGVPTNYIPMEWVTKGQSVYQDTKDSNGNYIKDSADFSYSVGGCPASGKTTLLNSDGTLDTNAKLDRATRIKLALIPFFANPSAYLGENYQNYDIGWSEFFQRTGTSSASGGEIITPVGSLNYTQRKAILDRLRWFQGWVNATSTANAYAEAGAYMMGTKTATPSGTVQYEIAGYYDPANQKLVRCQPYQVTNRSSSLPTTFGFCNAINDGTIYLQDINTVTGVTSLADATAKAPTALGIFNSDMVVQSYKATSTSSSWHSNSYTTNSTTTASPADNYVNGNTYYYFARKVIPNSNVDRFSGADLSNVNTIDSATGKYKTPIKSNECAGNGIYFLTDGQPAGVTWSDWTTSTSFSDMMRTSLSGSNVTFTGSGKTCSSTLPAVTGDSLNNYDQWKCIGEYSVALRNPVNPAGKRIYTAAVGFGATFGGFASTPPTQQTVSIDGVPKSKLVYNCDAVSDSHAKNLCKMSEYGYGNGSGGFFYTSTSQGVADSLKTFASSLGGNIKPIPASTITVPDDPYRADSQLATAYLPTMLATPGVNTAVWAGNVKKYNLNEGTLYGKSSSALFTDANGTLSTSTQDLWSDQNYTDNSAPTAGGMYSQLSTPNSGVASVRTVYVEDVTSASDSTPILRKVGVGTDGKPVGFDKLVDTVYTQEVQRKLLNFLGFDNIPTTSAAGATTPTYAAVKDMTLTAPTTAIKVLGGIVHSAPTAVSYSATLTDDGKVSATRDDYVLFGSMDGALHLVNADDASNSGGKEQFAFIPKKMLQNQPEALEKNAPSATPKSVGQPDAGIDAPWLVAADYTYDLSSKQVKVETASGKGVFAYGGLRMGGEAFYGMNLTDKSNPSLMFTITPTSSGFERMGQIWSKPTKAKIKTTTATDDKGTDVLIFGGGYDMKYESDSYVPSTTNLPKGNAVYMVNAKTGALIWSATYDASDSIKKNLTNSIVGGVTALDRNNDGFIDHIYFADLGGQVFRADFTNAGDSAYDANGAATVQAAFKNQRITRILANQYTDATKAKYNYRFYERPVVSFYRNATTNNLFALINIISGDRSSPLSTMRSADTTVTRDTYADRVYGIIDTDITKPNNIFFASNFNDTTNTNKATVVDIADTNLLALPSSIGSLNTGTTANVYTQTQKQTVTNILAAGKKSDNTKIAGWYYPLTRFDGYSNVPDGKGVGKSEVIGSFLYTTVYNPNMNYGTLNDDCTAKIKGGSERELYCLPYGICSDDTSKTGTGGFARAGMGIQELTLGPRSSTLTNQKLLIGTQTLADRAKGREGYNDDSLKKLATDTGANNIGLSGTGMNKPGGDGSMAELLFNERYALVPHTWYEVTK